MRGRCDRLSKGSRLKIYLVSQVRADSSVGEDVDLAVEQFLQFLPQSDQVKQGAAWIHLYQKIQIACSGSVSSSRRAEHPHIDRAVLGRQCHYEVPFLVKKSADIHTVRRPRKYVCSFKERSFPGVHDDCFASNAFFAVRVY